MVSMFWVHYKRKADGQEFHERLKIGRASCRERV